MLFEVFRTTFQAIYSIYYLDKGLSLNDVSSVKIFQIIAILIFEIPSGYLADKFGRIKILCFSALVMAISFIGLAISTSFLEFAVSEFIYGIGFALNSGTLLAYVNQYQQEKGILIDNKIMGYRIALVSLGTFISGNIGAYLYSYNIQLPFIISIIGMILYPVLIFILFKYLKLKDNKVSLENFSINAKNSFNNQDFKQKEFIYLSLFSILFTGASQFIYQFWSVYFIRELSFNQNKVFSLMTIASIVGGILFAKLSQNLNKNLIRITCILVLSIPLILMNIFKSPNYLLLMFIISQLGRGMIFSLCSSIENEVAFKFKNKSTTFSIIGTITQVSSILALCTIPLLINTLGFNSMFCLVGGVYLLLIPCLYKLKFLTENLEVNGKYTKEFMS